MTDYRFILFIFLYLLLAYSPHLMCYSYSEYMKRKWKIINDERKVLEVGWKQFSRAILLEFRNVPAV